MPVTIRSMREKDVADVVQLMLINWDGVLSRHHSSSVVARFRAVVTPEWVSEQMRWKQVFVAEDGQVLVATGALADFGVTGAHKCCVSQLFVQPDLQGKGIGTLLMAHLLDVARGVGADLLHAPSSRNAVPFYQRLGFVADTDQPDATDEITWMTLELRA